MALEKIATDSAESAYNPIGWGQKSDLPDSVGDCNGIQFGYQ